MPHKTKTVGQRMRRRRVTRRGMGDVQLPNEGGTRDPRLPARARRPGKQRDAPRHITGRRG